MLRSLRARHFVLVDDLSLDFGGGLTLFTGETGAGKSLLVESLLLLGGARASDDFIREGETEASLEAVFDVAARPDVRKRLAEMGFDSEGDELVLARKLVRGAAGRAFVNRSPARARDLAAVAELLVDVHGQSDQAFLRDPAFHREALDAFAGNAALLERGAAIYAAFREAEERVESLRASESGRGERVERLEFEIADIGRENFSRGDEEKLLAEERVLKNARRFVEAGGEASELLDGEGSGAVTRLAEAAKRLARLAEMDSAFAEARDSLADALVRAEDASRFLAAKLDGVDLSGERLDEVQRRLYALDRLKRKYGETLDAVLDRLEKARAEHAALTGGDESLREAETAFTEACRRYEKWAEELSAKRKKAARALESKMAGELPRLALERAAFKTDVRVAEKEGSPTRVGGAAAACAAHGSDRVEFLFSANPGEPPKPLAKTASGGELSRVMLALKTALLDSDAPRVLVFDEVDQGVGGRVAEAVGERLRALGKKHQVLCVSHLPQVAACGDRHVRVEKAVVKGRTVVRAVALGETERVEEVARMLAGKSVTDAARRHARELLKSTA